MKHTGRLLAFILTAAFALSAVACGGPLQPTPPMDDSNPDDPEEEEVSLHDAPAGMSDRLASALEGAEVRLL